jgi:hypothetical protein
LEAIHRVRTTESPFISTLCPIANSEQAARAIHYKAPNHSLRSICDSRVCPWSVQSAHFVERYGTVILASATSTCLAFSGICTSRFRSTILSSRPKSCVSFLPHFPKVETSSGPATSGHCPTTTSHNVTVAHDRRSACAQYHGVRKEVSSFTELGITAHYGDNTGADDDALIKSCRHP